MIRRRRRGSTRVLWFGLVGGDPAFGAASSQLRWRIIRVYQ